MGRANEWDDFKKWLEEHKELFALSDSLRDLNDRVDMANNVMITANNLVNSVCTHFDRKRNNRKRTKGRNR